MVLAIQGKTIDQVAAFNAESGVWIKQRLLRPVEEEINPVVYGGTVLYQAGNDFYGATRARSGIRSSESRRARTRDRIAHRLGH